MSEEQWTLVMWMLIGLGVWCVLVFGGAFLVRRRWSRRQQEGPGARSIPAPVEPWRRFTGSLAAVYGRVEWVRTRGVRRRYSEDQVLYGYGSAQVIQPLLGELKRDWGVRKPVQAAAAVAVAPNLVEVSAARVAYARGERAEAFEARLDAAGAPEYARDGVVEELRALAMDGSSSFDARALVGPLAFDVARYSNLVRLTACAGLVTEAQAHEASDRLGVAAVAAFGSWDAFADAYPDGLEAFTRRGNRPYLKALEWLRTEPRSPWVRFGWPASGR